jgi:hypothetical protein
MKEVGKPIARTNKLFYGSICSMIVMGLLVGPFWAFSSMGGNVIYNPILKSQLEVWVQINSTKTIHSEDLAGIAAGDKSIPVKLFENHTPSLFDFDESIFTNYGFGDYSETKFFDYQ